jgi:hypothetical protein
MKIVSPSGQETDWDTIAAVLPCVKEVWDVEARAMDAGISLVFDPVWSYRLGRQDL